MRLRSCSVRNLGKAYHFVAGLLITLSVGLVAPIQVAVLVTLAVGAGKEFYDWVNKDNHTPDANDFIATVVGGLVSVVMLAV